MMIIPNTAKVADIQRRYKYLVEKMKKTKKPLLIMNSGEPEAVVMDVATYNDLAQRVIELEEAYLLSIADEGVGEFRQGKTKTLKKGQTILDLIE